MVLLLGLPFQIFLCLFVLVRILSLLFQVAVVLLIDQELLEDFEIRQGNADSTKKDLERQQLKRYSLKSLIHKEDKTKLALLPCAINTISEIKHDRTGNVYRATRVIDEEGKIVNMMIWGTLAEKNYLWQRGTVIEIMGAAINHTQQRLDLRNSSQVLLSGKHAELKQLRDKIYETWT